MDGQILGRLALVSLGFATAGCAAAMEDPPDREVPPAGAVVTINKVVVGIILGDASAIEANTEAMILALRAKGFHAGFVSPGNPVPGTDPYITVQLSASPSPYPSDPNDFRPSQIQGQVYCLDGVVSGSRLPPGSVVSFEVRQRWAVGFGRLSMSECAREIAKKIMSRVKPN